MASTMEAAVSRVKVEKGMGPVLGRYLEAESSWEEEFDLVDDVVEEDLEEEEPIEDILQMEIGANGNWNVWY